MPELGFATLWGGGTLPGWRGRGSYRALVAERAARARARNIRYLQVDASPSSRPILERLGFLAVTTTTPFQVEAQPALTSSSRATDDTARSSVATTTSPIPADAASAANAAASLRCSASWRPESRAARRLAITAGSRGEARDGQLAGSEGGAHRLHLARRADGSRDRQTLDAGRPEGRRDPGEVLLEHGLHRQAGVRGRPEPREPVEVDDRVGRVGRCERLPDLEQHGRLSHADRAGDQEDAGDHGALRIGRHSCTTMHICIRCPLRGGGGLGQGDTWLLVGEDSGHFECSCGGRRGRQCRDGGRGA